MVNYLAIVACAIISMVVGGIWYGPLFGKKWMKIVGVDPGDMEARKKMQKAAGSLYAIQFLLSLLQAYILAAQLAYWPDAPGAVFAVFVWLGFIMPTLAGACMWTNEKRNIAWARFLIQAGYQLVNIVIFGQVLSMWH